MSHTRTARPRFIFRLAVLALAACGWGIIGGCETVYHATVGSSSAPRLAINAPANIDTSNGDADLAGRTAMLPACEPSAGCVSVLSYNLKHRDVPLQLEAIAKHLHATCDRLPDFILLQEVVFNRSPRRGLDNTAAELAQRIGYEARGTARAGGSEGVAILSRLPFDHYEHLHVKARDSLLEGGFPRVSVMGECFVPGVGRVRVVNVHLAHRPSQNQVRRSQLRETFDWMNRRQQEMPADLIIFGGDLNIEPHWDEYLVLSDPQFTGMTLHDHNSSLPSSGRINNTYRRVDYIFAAAPGRSVSSLGEAIFWPSGIPTIDGSATFWPSDHLPLLHAFSLSAPQ